LLPHDLLLDLFFVEEVLSIKVFSAFNTFADRKGIFLHLRDKQMISPLLAKLLPSQVNVFQ